jgi:hypothetical protein
MNRNEQQAFCRSRRAPSSKDSAQALLRSLLLAA